MITSLDLPLGFWLDLVLIILATAHAWQYRARGWGIPAIAVYGTVAAWYLGDVLYNGYDNYTAMFSPDVLNMAWMQVAGFLIAVTCVIPLLHAEINARYAKDRSQVLALINDPNTLARLQGQLGITLSALTVVWSVVTIVGLALVDFDVQGVLAPWLGHKATLFNRGRIGGGIDFLYSAAQYVSGFCLAGFGVVAALAKRPKVQNLAIFLIVLSWPYVLIGRTRNSMLATVLPGLLCLVFLRLHRKPVVQLAVLVAGFLAINAWFLFVMANRTNRDIAAAFASSESTQSAPVRHLGLNMFEELCHINTFLQNGTYSPNWGSRYFAELVNPVPRSFWPGKPKPGLDYAVARGQTALSTSEAVTATISTGMIGQGVVNFGPWLGPPAAAILMGLWVTVLARFDLTGRKLGHVALYFVGLVLTFNLGRDITFLVAFPLLFGYGLLTFVDRSIARGRGK